MKDVPGEVVSLQRDLDVLGLGPCIAGDVISSGRRSTVIRLTLPHRGDLVLKQFTASASTRHARYHGTPLARFEYERNASLYLLSGLEGCIAEPVAWAVADGRHLFAQEFVHGTLLSQFAATADVQERQAVVAALERVVERAHEALIFDLDLHLRNVMVSRDAGGAFAAHWRPAACRGKAFHRFLATLADSA